MKKSMLKIGLILLLALVLIGMAGCNPVDMLYNVSSGDESASERASGAESEDPPRILSSDKVMPLFVDISLYDEENYSKIYLGKKFDFKVTYDGSEFSVPTTYKKVTKNGWTLLETSEYDEESSILSCEAVETILENENGKQISAVFYNSSNSSVLLKKCNIVKFKILGNNLIDGSDTLGDYNINGVSNHSAITDVIEALGAPSHFYAVNDSSYYLDYFITKEDRRNGITVYINPLDDSVGAIEFAYYK